MLTFEQIKELIEQVAERGLGGLEIERSGFRLKIEGRGNAVGVTADSGQAPPSTSGAGALSEALPPASTSIGHPPSASSAPTPSGSEAEKEGETTTEDPLAGSHVLTSPIVGTFYRRPSPDADPFVQVGDRVRKGQVLCIVEAMKLMNEIESDADGELLEIFPENAQPVEYGERLFAIRAG